MNYMTELDYMTMSPDPFASDLGASSSGVFDSIFGGFFDSSLGLVAIILIVLAFLGPIILKIVAKWRIFEKAGEYGWASLIPFYNNYIFHEITWENGWLFLTSYVPGLNYVIKVISYIKLCKGFDKNPVFALGLLVQEPIFLAILAFDDCEYNY